MMASTRLMGLNKSVPMDQDLYDGNFNTPAIKLQPHGHLTLFPEGSGEKLDATHKIQAGQIFLPAIFILNKINERSIIYLSICIMRRKTL